ADLAPPETTVIPNELVTRGVLSYLTGYRGLDPDKMGMKIPHRVAILREANTAFGAQALQSGEQIGLHTNDSSYLTQGVIDLPFPMSISQLAVEQEKGVKTFLPQTGFVEPRLPVRDQTHLDAIPPYDPASAASTAGQSLRMILATIDRARV